VEPWGRSNERPEALGLGHVLATVRRRWWALLGGTLVGAALVIVGGWEGASYRATTRLLVGSMGGDYSSLRAAGRQAETYADLATSEPVLRAASARLSPRPKVAQLRRDVTATADDVTRLLSISAAGDRPARATATADAVAAALRATNPRMARDLRIVEPARAPSAPDGRSKALLAIAAFTGLLATLTALVTVDARRRRHVAHLAALTLAGMLVAAAAPAPAAALEPAMWLSRAEILRLPEQGPAWDQLQEVANEPLGQADLSDQDSSHDIHVLAAALVYARTGEERLRAKAAAGVMGAIGTERGGRTLALARGLVSYAVAADLIDLAAYDPGKAGVFRGWLADVRREELAPADNPTLIATHELRPNNWGTHAGASRIAADIYLGDQGDLARAAAVFAGWLGDRATYSGFRYGEDLSWQANADEPVGVNPPGATRDGESIDGALPDDMRRGCSLRFPPCPTQYPWEAMQGAVVQAELLSRQGYDAWNWGNQALRRAATFLFSLYRRYGAEEWGAPAGDAWVPWLLNARYGTDFPARTPAPPGKGMGFTDWSANCPAAPCTAPRGPRRAVAPIAAAPSPGAPAGRDAGRATPGAVAAAAGVLGLLCLLAFLRLRGAWHRRRPGHQL
jgi:capsular polysaccharide biosynthesis protein